MVEPSSRRSACRVQSRRTIVKRCLHDSAGGLLISESTRVVFSIEGLVLHRVQMLTKWWHDDCTVDFSRGESIFFKT